MKAQVTPLIEEIDAYRALIASATMAALQADEVAALAGYSREPWRLNDPPGVVRYVPREEGAKPEKGAKP